MSEEYERGLKDAWEYARKIGHNSQLGLEDIGFDFSQMPRTDYNPSWWLVMNYPIEEVIKIFKKEEPNVTSCQSIKIINKQNKNSTIISPEGLKHFKEKWDELMSNVNIVSVNNEDVVPFYEPMWEQGDPPKSGKYLVTRNYAANACIVDTAKFTKDLYHLDEYTFYDKKNKSGWYNYDNEYGYYEVDGVVAWQYLPEPFEG